MLHCGCVWLGIDSRCLCLWLWLLLLLLRQGATYSNTGGNACYAEFGMTDSNGNGMRLQSFSSQSKRARQSACAAMFA